MSKKRLTGVACACVLGFCTPPANAALIDNGNGLIYDDALNITWLADANFALTNGDDDDGAMTWDEAVSWTSNLNYLGITGWRLPTAVACGSGLTCAGAGGEMYHLYYDDTGTARDLSQWFHSIQGNYWSSEEYTADNPLDSAWVYYFSGSFTGSQSVAYKTANTFVWAVHDGNISAVPLPAAAWLFGSGLLGLLGVARQRRHV